MTPNTETDPAHTLETLLRQRHSCRGFLPDALPRDTIERIAHMAQHTASWCNAQPWQLFIISGTNKEALSQNLLAAAEAQQPTVPDFTWPNSYPGVHGQRRRTCGFALYDSVGVARGDREASARQALENFRFFGAPHVAIVTCDAELGTYGAIDTGAYVANFMLAAQSLGVAAIAQAALAGWPDLVREALAIPAQQRIVCGISFGLEDPQHPANGFRTERAALNEVLHWRA